MTIRLQEVVRSEVEGGLSGPANPIPSQSIDCGCGQLPCPKLAKFATRGLYVGLVCCIGLLQAASYAYFYISGPTIARRFKFDPRLMEWLLVLPESIPFILGLTVAYWGDRIHRASWTGGLVLLQSVGYFVLIIPHFTHRVRVIEETENATHMSLYADDSPELCSAGASRVIVEEDEPCYVMLFTVIAVQVLAGMANIAYYALAISYLDDNTKKKHVAAFVGVVLAVKVTGVLVGYLLAWGCLRIDAETLRVVASYQEQIGAWWLGFPILAVLLLVPGLLLSWFPRRLPSEVVEQAAATLLGRGNRYNRGPHRSVSQKVGSPSFCPSLTRLLTNKTLMCNILSSVFCAAALTNFAYHENSILESRFHVPRPTGILLGFNDPMTSRLTSSILQPVLIGLIIILTGLVISKGNPRAKYVVGYNFFMVAFAAVIIFFLIFTSCKKPPIVGMNRGSLDLLRYCNRNCHCSKDADFRPVCDKQGMYTFYSPCHAGCTASSYVDSVKVYSECECVEEKMGQGNHEARDGPCGSNNCQTGWLAFEFGAMLAYSLIASTFVGDLLIGLRSVYKQDKALAIGFWLTWLAIFVNVVGKILYQTIADLTCQHWGNQKSICHLHDGTSHGDYLCYLTGSLLAASALLKILVWLFSADIHLYNQPESEVREPSSGTELQELVPPPTTAQDRPQESASTNGPAHTTVEVNNTPEIILETAAPEENSIRQDEESQTASTPLKYGPLGPGDRRNPAEPSPPQKSRTKRSKSNNVDSEDDLDSSSDESKKDSSPRVAYSPLEIDSDVESDLGSTAPRSGKHVIRKEQLKREFPNPDDYGDPRSLRNGLFRSQPGRDDGSAKTDSFEYSKIKGKENTVPKKGDFNEVGIPIVDPRAEPEIRSTPDPSNRRFLKDVKSLIDRYEHNASQEALDGDRSSVKSNDSTRTRLENKIMPGVPLVAMAPTRPTSRGQSSSGFGSLQDFQEKVPAAANPRTTPSPKSVNKGSKGSLVTDL